VAKQTEKKAAFGRGRQKGSTIAHPYLGLDVRYIGRIWRVISAHQSSADVEPWLTLREGAVELAVKPHEVSLVWD
jgi:hypothetical protein